MTTEEKLEENRVMFGWKINTPDCSDREAYEILALPNCPIKLPRARSMTRAKLDLDALKPSLIQFYNTNKPTQHEPT